MIPLVVEDCTIKFKKMYVWSYRLCGERSEQQKALCREKRGGW
jgi:hypothetical protein